MNETMEGAFRQPLKDARRDRRDATETNDALDASVRPVRSSNSSGVGIASSYIQNQIQLCRSLNVWDENDPRFLERQDSFDRGHLDAEPDDQLAFRPNIICQSRSDPRLSNPIPTTINASLSAPNDLGFMRRSFVFDENALTMDESQRTGSGSAGALCMDENDHIGEIDAEKEFLKFPTANDNFMTRESSSDSSSSSSEYECRSELDNVLRNGQAVEKMVKVNFGSQDSLHSSSHPSPNEDDISRPNEEDCGDDTPKMSNGNVMTTASDLPQVPSPVSDKYPSSIDTLHDLADMNDLDRSTRSKSFCKKQRTLSQVSLMSLLKIESIAEDNAFNDSLDQINLEETVTFSKMSEQDEGSVISELGDSNRDGDDGALSKDSDSRYEYINGNLSLDETRNATNDLTNETEENVVRIDIMPLAGGRKSPVNELDISEISDEHKKSPRPKQKSTGSFLPLPNPEARVIQNPPHSRSSSLQSQGNSPVDEESSDFFLRSIKSTDHVTHISDAPDYDYNSISSSDEDAKSPTAHQNPPKTEEYVSPTERRRRALETKEQQASDKVCGLLGLPKDEGARKMNRGIMSKDTELHLRNLLKKDRDSEQKNQHNAAAANTSTTDEHESDDSYQKLDDQKWERTRQERLIKRQSTEKFKRARSDGQPTKPEDKTPGGAGGLRNSLPIKINEVNFDERNEQSLQGNSIEAGRAAKYDDSTEPGESSSTADVSNNVRWSINRNSISSGRTNGELPTRAMPRKSTCPMQRVDVDDDSTVFSNFNKSLRGLLGKTHRNSDASNESNAQSLQSRPTMKRTGSIMNFFGMSPLVDDDDDEQRANRDSRSTHNSRRKSSLAAFLGWGPIDVDDKEDDAMESDDESTDDEGDETSWNGNILSEGEYYLAMSMLVYIYALLRETAMLGHTDISFDEVDVNSFHSELDSIDGILAKTKSAGYIIRVVLDELEKKDAFETVSDTSVLKEFKKWVSDSRCTQLDMATESTIKELRRKVARTRWKRAISTVRITIRLKKSSSHMNIAFDKSKLRSDPDFNKKRTKTTSSLAARNSGAALSKSMMWVSSAKTQIMNSLGVDSTNDDQSAAKDKRHHTLVSNDEIKKIIDDALEQPRFFRPGSLMSNLIESGIEVVWFGDRHPNDVVYCVCCNRKQKRVSVVFRGTVNSHNWLMNMKFSMAEHINPIAEDYCGRSDFFGLHTGFSLYLSRQRKDDSNTKIEEIFLMIDEIGRALAPDGDYELSITGHSLGGALATLLSFYAATSSMFENLKTIRVFTYAAPRVGCQRFLYAYQHLEQKGKIRLARFSNTQDIVPLIPFTCVDKFKIGRPYMHVGMHIRLHGTSNWAQYWLRNALDVTYPRQQGILSHIERGFLNSVFMNINTLKGYTKNHTLSEYQRRIHFALEFRNALAKTSLKYDKRRNRVKTLEEYYFIRGATIVTCTKDLTQVSLETRENERSQRRLRRMVAALVIVALIEGIALLRVLDISLSCKTVPKVIYPLLCFVCSHATEEHSTDQKSSSTMNIPDASLLPEKTVPMTTTESDTNIPVAIQPDIMVTTDLISTTVLPYTSNSDDGMSLDTELIAPKKHILASAHDMRISIISNQTSGWQQSNGVDLFYKANLIWGIRRDHHKVPSAIVDQRMKSFDTSVLLTIPPFVGTPDNQTITKVWAG